MPSAPHATVPVLGDMNTVPGLFVRACIEHPEKSLGKYVYVATYYLSFPEMLKVWGEVLGRKTVYVEVSTESMKNLYGEGGLETALQCRLGETILAITSKEGLGTAEELGLQDLIRFRARLSF